MKKRISFSSSQMVLFGFLATILLGSILLKLPISAASGNSVPYIDALFTATTATCVTGLVTVPTFSTWSLFGQVVILFLIQIGGLGVITVISGVLIALNRKIGIDKRILIQDSFNLNSLAGIVKFIKKVTFGTLLVEGIGALLYMTVFIPEFGIKGVWISVFNAVSAFCNAGIDIISANSLCDYALHPMINFITCALIILGGLGYIVWWDVIRILGDKKRRHFKFLTLQSKIALSTTAILLLAGTVFFLIFEFNNPQTIKDYSFFEKLEVAFFQSVTTRTAGFITIPQENLTSASVLTSLLLMFIGGSPVGTAGGIKTVTFAVLIITAFSMIKNKKSAEIFNRQLSVDAIKKAVAVFIMSFTIMFTSSVLLACTTDADLINILYETVSATATVGVTRNLTSSLGTLGKIIIIATMYLGRVGPISLATAFNIHKGSKNLVVNPVEEINVG